MKKRAKNPGVDFGSPAFTDGRKRGGREHQRATQMKLFLASASFATVVGCSSGQFKEEAKKDAASTQPEQAAHHSSAPERPKSGNPESSAEYHFSMAQAYVAEGNSDRAIEEYRLTLMFDPHSPLVYARLATEYIKKGQLSAAMEACKEALQRDPKFTDARLLLAGLYSSSRDSDAAVAEYDRILKVDPRHEEAAVYKAQVLIEDGHPEEAVQALRLFVKKNSESAVAFFYLGKAEQGMRHVKEAVHAYRKAMEIRSPFSQAALALGFLYEEQKMNSQAVATYKELYENTQDLSAANRLATIYLKEEKFPQAMPYLEAMASMDPDDMNARVKLGLVQMELKQYEQAIATFKMIVQKSPDAERVHYYLGSIYEEIKQVDSAIAEFKQIKSGSKLYTDAVLRVSLLLKQQGKMGEAKEFIQGAIALSPNIPNFYVFRASLEEEGKNLPEAVKILEAAVKKFAGDEKVRYYLGSLYDRQGEIDKGLEQMEAILNINPDNVDALNYIGYTWTTRGTRLNEAEALLRRALSLRPENGYIQDSWGWYLYIRGRTDEAVVELEKAVKMKPTEATILEHLADAYLRSNLPEKALVRYQDAAKFSENDEVKRKVESKRDNLERALVRKGPPQSPTRSPAGGK